MSDVPEETELGRFALVEGISGAVYLRSVADVSNGWHEVTHGFGVDMTWGEICYIEGDQVEVLFWGLSDDR